MMGRRRRIVVVSAASSSRDNVSTVRCGAMPAHQSTSSRASSSVAVTSSLRGVAVSGQYGEEGRDVSS